MQSREPRLHLQFSRVAKGRFRVVVLDSPNGSGQEASLDIDLESLWRSARFGLLRTGAQGEWRNFKLSGRVESATLHPEELGALLFSGLFRRGVRTCLEASLNLAHDRGQPVLVRLGFDLEDSEGRKLAALPWELLYHRERRSFLARDRASSLGRHVSGTSSIRRQPPPYPLRIAVLHSQPRGTLGLQLELERSYLEEAWNEHQGVELSFHEASRRCLLDVLRENVHALHFMGHGDLCSASGKGELYFEDEHGEPTPVEGTTLAQMIQGHPSLRLIVLNACRSGEVPIGRQADAFAGVATALVRVGSQAVISMALPISDLAAILFSRFLYRSLAAGRALHSAVTEGRLGIFAEAPDAWEWAVPVLMDPTSDGRIFEPARNDVVPERARRCFDEGCRWYYGGDFQAAQSSFKQARELAGAFPEAELYSCLCVLSTCSPASLEPVLAHEVNRRLHLLAQDDSSRISEPARLALGLLRHEYFVPRRIRAGGIDSKSLFAELEKRRPSTRARRLVASVSRASRADFRFHLGDH